MSLMEAAPGRAEALSRVTDEMVAAYQRDGVLWIRGLLSPSWIELIELGIQRNINSVGPYSKKYHTDGGFYYDDMLNFRVNPEYQMLVADSPIVDVMARVLQTKELWLFSDQIFVKEGGYSHRSRWHQDVGYWLADGDKMAAIWIATGPLTGAETLEVIPGSFKGPIYDLGTTSRGAPMPGASGPPIPDIQSEREKWPIISHASLPGDVLIFHPGALHGGAEMREGGSRRSLTLRFFGDGTRYVEREIPADPAFPGIKEFLKPGDLLRHSWFPQVYPRPEPR